MPIEENKKLKVIREFSRFAKEYDNYNIIQSEVAKALVEKLESKKYKRVIDIGCGSGEVYKNFIAQRVEFEEFIAFDYSSQMLSLHPSDDNMTKVLGDFSSVDDLNKLNYQDAIVISSSALQWSSDLDLTLSFLSKSISNIYLAIFTSNTFKTLHNTAQISSPIYTEDIVKSSISKYFDAKFETKEYIVSFDNTRDMLKYIKRSGVSGGDRVLDYKNTKKLLEDYPLDYLEFEVLFVEAISLVK